MSALTFPMRFSLSNLPDALVASSQGRRRSRLRGLDITRTSGLSSSSTDVENRPFAST
jgi:hypothetical protein